MNKQAEFSRKKDGRLTIDFHDPAYVRADLIIIDRKDSSVHAVLHENSHFIGHISRELVKDIVDKDAVTLTAPHYFSGTINLHSKISVIN